MHGCIQYVSFTCHLTIPPPLVPWNSSGPRMLQARRVLQDCRRQPWQQNLVADPAAAALRHLRYLVLQALDVIIEASCPFVIGIVDL